MHKITKPQRRGKLKNPYKLIFKYLLDKTVLIADIIDITIEYIKNEPINNGNITRVIENIGDFNMGNPFGIAYDGIYIYINISRENKILVTDTEEKLITSWGGFGIENGQFHYIRNSVIYDCYIYVADLLNRRIQIFSIPDGRFIRSIKHTNPCWGISVYKSLIYVCSIDEDEISVYTKKGELMKTIRIPWKTVGDSNWRASIGPCNLIVIEDEIYIAGYYCGMIICLSIKGEYKFCLNGEDTGGRKFGRPQAIYLSDDSLYVGDKHGIQQFNRNKNFSFVKKFGGDKDYESSSITFVGDTCYSTDWDHGQVYIFK